MVKDHSDSQRRNPLPPLHKLLFLISSKGSFIYTIPDRIAHTTPYVTPVMEDWLEQDIAQWAHHEIFLVPASAPVYRLVHTNPRLLIRKSSPWSIGNGLPLIILMVLYNLSINKISIIIKSTSFLPGFLIQTNSSALQFFNIFFI